MSKYYYAVKEGKIPGIYKTWAECEKQVKGYPGAKFKKFPSYEEALKFTNPNQVITYNIKELDDKKVTMDKKMDKKDKPDEIEEIDIKDNEAIAYVDGSFDLSTKTYSYGVVFITNKGKETYSAREDNEELAEMRNVSGELRGAEVAMEIAMEKGYDSLYLHFDYTGIEQWALGNWKTNKEGTKSYKRFYDNIKDRLDVKFIKVKAHSGIKYNEEADKLAAEAIIKE